MDVVVVDLGENDLIANAHREVPAAVERARVDPPEVADSRQRYRHQAVVELVHAVAAERHLAADGHALAQLEAGDRVLRARDHRPLAGDDGQLLGGVVQRFDVGLGLAHAHVQGDLGDPGHGHHRGQAQRLLQSRPDLVEISLLQARSRRFHGAHPSMSFPQARHTRTLLPSSVNRLPTRVGLPQEGQTSCTLDRFSGASFSITPPGITCWLLELRGAGRGLVCRLIMLTFSTTTRPRSGSTRTTVPRLPESLPAITCTESPFLILIFASATSYSTSGASETIFMKLRSRSSRATGPKMRVPRGLRWLSMITAAFSSNAIEVPSSRPCGFFVRTTTALTTSPFLIAPGGVAVLTVPTMMSPTRA